MKPSEILRRAAEQIFTEENRFCCMAIDKFDHHKKNHKKACKYFGGLFDDGTSLWFGHTYSHEHQKHRVMALLMTAAMAESVGE